MRRRKPTKVCHTSTDLWTQQMQVREEGVRRGFLGERGKPVVQHSVLDTPSRGVVRVWLWGVVAGIRRLIVHIRGERGLSTMGNCPDCLIIYPIASTTPNVSGFRSMQIAGSVDGACSLRYLVGYVPHRGGRHLGRKWHLRVQGCERDRNSSQTRCLAIRTLHATAILSVSEVACRREAMSQGTGKSPCPSSETDSPS